MRICIDACVLDHPMTGIGRYTLNLINALALVDHENDYFLLFNASIPRVLSVGENFTPVVSKKLFPLPFVGSQINLPHLLKKLQIDVFHCPKNWQFPFLKPCRYVVTVHDLYPLLFPWKSGSIKEALYYRFYRASMHSIPKKADGIIVDSGHSRQDVVRLLKVSQNKIWVIPLAIDDMFQTIHDPSAIESIKAKYDIRFPFILHVGADERKNTSTVIKAFHRAITISKDSDYNLVIAGRLGKLYLGLINLINRLNLKDRIIFTGGVSDEDLVLLYNAARLLAYPSLHGPGLPPLEAMACGTPVLTSRSSPLSEMVGEAGLLVEPTSVNEIAKGILTILSDKDLWEELRQRSLERVKMFSWKKVAEETFKVYEAVYEKPPFSYRG